MAQVNQSYSEIKSKLDELLNDLQRDDIGVDEALKTYEQGMEMITMLETMLNEAENKITKLKAKFE